MTKSNKRRRERKHCPHCPYFTRHDKHLVRHLVAEHRFAWFSVYLESRKYIREVTRACLPDPDYYTLNEFFCCCGGMTYGADNAISHFNSRRGVARHYAECVLGYRADGYSELS